MGKKRRIINNKSKFGSKYSTHPALTTDTEETTVEAPVIEKTVLETTLPPIPKKKTVVTPTKSILNKNKTTKSK